MPKVTEEHKAARRQQITQAALRLFARSGFAATTMADIIEESGLSAGAIYGHYKSKDELIRLAVAEIMDARFLDVATARERDPLPTPGEVVRLLVTGLSEQIGELQLLLQVWGQVPINPELRTVATEVGARFTDMFCGYLTQWYRASAGLDAAASSELAQRHVPLYVGMVHGYVTQSALFAGFDGEAYLEVVDTVRLPAS
ncbi:TetR/AcrR family transcriptional regulator [Leifsonia sp. ZF2019]|uniref:TetR/AcrR family transcriptional regulator n=1 Tax=Leifsonia sp. ZF2019 TaxID=2781978 RepID=UPI001CBDC57E|nr:TetR/AcrR family transcriptional regulator [Leifsonia sp. ZF2019]UAJ78473.1 TetR/AcrR family transcriptional regulator [Leifsonia sp. ZF2019]